MDLINYYPTTCHLLQEQIKKEVVKHEMIIKKIYYNKYDSMETEVQKIGPRRRKLLNGKPHGIINSYNSCGCFNRGKIVKYVSDDATYIDNKLLVKMYLYKDRYILDNFGPMRIFEFIIKDGYLVNLDHPKNLMLKGNYKRYKLKVNIGPACDIWFDFIGSN